MGFWLAQILGLIGSLISITSLQSGSRKRILALQLLCCVLWVAQYGLLGAWTGVLINLLGLARSTVCAFNDRPGPAAGRGWPSFWPAICCREAGCSPPGWF